MTTKKTTKKATKKTTEKLIEIIKEMAEIIGLTTDGVQYHIRNLKAH